MNLIVCIMALLSLGSNAYGIGPLSPAKSSPPLYVHENQDENVHPGSSYPVLRFPTSSRAKTIDTIKRPYEGPCTRLKDRGSPIVHKTAVRSACEKGFGAAQDAGKLALEASALLVFSPFYAGWKACKFFRRNEIDFEWNGELWYIKRTQTNHPREYINIRVKRRNAHKSILRIFQSHPTARFRASDLDHYFRKIVGSTLKCIADVKYVYMTFTDREEMGRFMLDNPIDWKMH